jgi:hypothetical protein
VKRLEDLVEDCVHTEMLGEMYLPYCSPTHPRMEVRVMAATYLLRHRTAEAKAVLEEAAKGEGLIPSTQPNTSP